MGACFSERESRGMLRPQQHGFRGEASWDLRFIPSARTEMCTPNSWTSLEHGLRRVLRMFSRHAAQLAYKSFPRAVGVQSCCGARPRKYTQLSIRPSLRSIATKLIELSVDCIWSGTRSVLIFALSSRRSVILPAQLLQSQKYSGLLRHGDLAFGSLSSRKSLPCCR